MIYYKMNQVKGEVGKATGKWFARSITSGTLETEDIAEHIQSNCTVKYSDVIAVLRELAEVLKEKMQEGYSVHLDNIGYMHIAMSSKCVDTLDEFDQSKHMRRPRVVFHPEYTREKDSQGVYRRKCWMTAGSTAKELPKNENTTNV